MLPSAAAFAAVTVTVVPVALVEIPCALAPVIVSVSPRVAAALPDPPARVISFVETAPDDTVKFVELNDAIPLLDVVASSAATVIIPAPSVISIPSPAVSICPKSESTLAVV